MACWEAVPQCAGCVNFLMRANPCGSPFSPLLPSSSWFSSSCPSLSIKDELLWSVLCPWILVNLGVDEKVCGEGHTQPLVTRFKLRLYGVGPVTPCHHNPPLSSVS